jgi:hypothetical protein
LFRYIYRFSIVYYLVWFRKVAKNNIDNNDLSSQLTPIFEVHLPSTDYCHSIPTKPDHYVAIAK